MDAVKVGLGDAGADHFHGGVNHVVLFGEFVGDEGKGGGYPAFGEEMLMVAALVELGYGLLYEQDGA